MPIPGDVCTSISAKDPSKRCTAPSLPLRRKSTGPPQSRILGPKLILPMHSRKIQVAVVLDMYIRREQAPNMVNYRAHMEPFSMSHFMSHSRTVNPPSIHYISRDHPNAHELTNHIPHPSPAPGLRSPGAPGKTLRRWYGMVPVSPTGTTASFPRIH